MGQKTKIRQKPQDEKRKMLKYLRKIGEGTMAYCTNYRAVFSCGQQNENISDILFDIGQIIKIRFPISYINIEDRTLKMCIQGEADFVY